MGSEECRKLYKEALLFRALPKRVRDHRLFV
jgi:hypothetical protein